MVERVKSREVSVWSSRAKPPRQRLAFAFEDECNDSVDRNGDRILCDEAQERTAEQEFAVYGEQDEEAVSNGVQADDAFAVRCAWHWPFGLDIAEKIGELMVEKINTQYIYTSEIHEQQLHVSPTGFYGFSIPLGARCALCLCPNAGRTPAALRADDLVRREVVHLSDRCWRRHEDMAATP